MSSKFSMTCFGWLLLWSFSVVSGMALSSPSTLDDEGTKSLQVMRKVLGPGLPPYMVELYNRLKENRMPHRTSNTVRSFLPVPGKLGDRDVLVFNISGVHSSEYIDRADLHLQWKSPAGRPSKKPKLRLSVLNLNRPSRPEVEFVQLLRRSTWGNWHTLDLTDAIIACLEGQEKAEHRLVGFVVQEESESGTAFEVDVSSVFSKPFLVIFSEDDDHLGLEEIEKNKDKSQNSSTVQDARRKREIFDNELPDFPLGRGSRTEIQARSKHRSLDSGSVGDIPKNTKNNNLSWREKRRRQRKRKQRRMQLKWRWPASFQDGDEGDELSSEEDDEDEDSRRDVSCRRRSLVVDFDKIGWKDYIIAPKKFDAFLCSGDCAFSQLIKAKKTSNYATLRSLMYSTQDSDGSPPLCCVPETLSAVPLLFYDENRNVVLKKFPDMRVESCTCR